MALALGVLTIDVTVVRVALPTMQAELGLSDIGQQWIVNAYLLALAVLVVVGGRAGDLWGRRRVFLAGLAVFTLGSILSGTAQGEAWIIASRALQGAGAAVMTPGAFAIVTDSVPPERLPRAMGALAGAASVGLSLGPLLGGVLIELIGWRSIFFINVPVAALTAAVVLRGVPGAGPAPATVALDLRGLVALAAGMSALVLALMQADVWGWGSPAILGLLAGATVALAVFARWELRAPAPLVELRLLRVGSIAAGNAIAGALQFTVTAMTVFLAIFLQNVLGNSPLGAGLLLLPVTLPLLVASPLAGLVTERVGVRLPATAGMGLCAAGSLWIGLEADAAGAGPLVPGMIAFGLGIAVAMTVMTTAVMAGAPPGQRGMVSGIYNTVRYVGAALGVAVVSALFYSVESDRLSEQLAAGDLTRAEARDVEGLLAGSSEAQARIDHLDAASAEKVRSAARDSFADAFGVSMILLAAISAIGGLLAATLLGRPRRGPPERPHPAAA